MWRNHLAAALRSLARNRLYSFIGILSLAIGLCAALVAGLIVRNEVSYDRFIAGYLHTYLVVSTYTPPDRPVFYEVGSPSALAARLESKLSEIEAGSRIAESEMQLQRGQVGATEKTYWADPDIFEVLPLPAIAGDLRTALRRPDGIVLTRSVARKYFGREQPLGETLQWDGKHPMTVMAVIEDLPANGTHLASGIFVSGLARDSVLTQADRIAVAKPDWTMTFFPTLRTYVRLSPGSSTAPLRQALPALATELMHKGLKGPDVAASLNLLRLDRIHLSTELTQSSSDPFTFGADPGVRNRLAMTTAIGALILLIACINFVNLATARRTRRAVEVGIRKAAGATKGVLVLQFLAETLLHVALAAGIAIAMTELLLPGVNAFLHTNAALDYSDPQLLTWVCAGVIAAGILAGTYPALFLSAFHPAAVLRRVIGGAGGSAGRQTLVTLQFAILIGLMVAAAVVYRQLGFATHDALRVDTDEVLIVKSRCTGVLRQEMMKLPGVLGATCTSSNFMTDALTVSVRMQGKSPLTAIFRSIDADAPGVYGLTLAAGRWFAAGSSNATDMTGPVLINETAARRLGFPSAQSAVGAILDFGSGKALPGEIIGVMRDFTLTSITKEIAPTAYLQTDDADHVAVKLSGNAIPETLAAIDRLQASMGSPAAPSRFFLNDYVQSLYIGMLREARLFGAFCVIAILLACLGLAGLSASMAERRTKEIGIRKALGANGGNIARLLLLQFARPVVWANLIAWPIAGLYLMRWLESYVYRIDLSLWLFPAAGMLALAIALLTVSTHCHFIARAKPIEALRHE